MWNGVPEPGCVQPSRTSSGMVVAGSNAASHSSAAPNCSAEKSQVSPPMWGNGKMSAGRSPSATSRRSAMARPIAWIDESVWRAPLGSEVVPEV